MSIPFVQYQLPGGFPKNILIDRSAEIERMAQAVIANGGTFTAEVLRTSEISLAVEWNDADIAIELTENGPGVETAVDRLVEKAYKIIIRGVA